MKKRSGGGQGQGGGLEKQGEEKEEDGEEVQPSVPSARMDRGLLLLF